MNVYQITSSRGGLSDYDDKGTPGSFKFGSNLDIRKIIDSISCGQAMRDIGNTLQSPSASVSPSASASPSASQSPSPSSSPSPSASVSASPSAASPSVSPSPSASTSPSASVSPSASASPSSSVSFSPSPSAGLKTVFADLIHWWVNGSDGFLYGFGNTGKIYKIDSEYNCYQVYDQKQEIKGAVEKPSASGNKYLIWMTNTEIHHKLIPGSSSWNDVDKTLSDYPKTNLTGADYHTAVQVGGAVYIANKETLALIGYDDSYTNEALDLVPGNVAVTLLERNGQVIIGTARSTALETAINAAIDSEYPLAQIGTDGDVYYSDMLNSIPIKRFPGGGKVNPGGVTNQISSVNFFQWQQDALSWTDKKEVGNLSLWGVYGATDGKNGIYSLGRKNKNQPFVMNLEYAMDVDEIGALTMINGLAIASYRDGSSFGVRVVDSTVKATAVYEGLDFKSPIKSPEKVTVFPYAELYMKPLPTGCSVQFWYRMDKNGAFVQAKTADGQNSFTTANAQKCTFRLDAAGDIYEPKLVLVPYLNTTPDILRIRSYFN